EAHTYLPLPIPLYASTAMTKRPDLQGIRGLAIVAVLAFHLNEAKFPSGFVGVDMFFVLSGYLMSVILSKEDTIDMSVFRQFYFRRFKRIVPLYAIMIAVLTIVIPCFLLRRDVLEFCKDVVWAAVFGTNIHDVLDEKDYFAEVFDSNVLTHTWSLGVEIQYYLIVPFIILAQRKLPQKWMCMFLLAVLLIGSLAFQLLSSPNVAFNLLLSRVWQFLAGGIAHEVSSWTPLNEFRSGTVKYEKLRTDEHAEIEIDCVEPNDAEVQTFFNSALASPSTDLLSFALFVLVLSPWNILPAAALRFVAVLVTSGLLIMGTQENRQGVLLTNRPLVYMGDISYIVYLAHWPIIIIWKSVTDSISLSLIAVLFCLMITFVLSIIAHHTAEQYFIRATAKTASITVAILYGFLAVALLLNIPLRISTALEGQATVDVQAAIKWNEKESHTTYWNKRPFKDCVNDPEGTKMRDGYSGKKEYECIWKPTNATGPLKMLVICNSIAHRATKILKPIIEQNFPQIALMRLYANSACQPVDIVKRCRSYFDGVHKLVRAMKPDMTFVISDNSKRLMTPLTNGTDDVATTDLTVFLQSLANSSRLVVLDEFYPQPATSAGMATSMHKRLLRNQSTTDLKGTLESFQAKYANYFARLDRVLIPNVIRHNTSAALCAEEKGLCWWYNRRNLHSYFTDNLHLSADGLELLRDSYAKIIQNVIDRLGVTRI
ncbi:hypothetical protein PENTCL1PPCAC_15080, partial [Pristionchus entomophagus]